MTTGEKILDAIAKLDVKLDAILKEQGEQKKALEAIKETLPTEPDLDK